MLVLLPALLLAAAGIVLMIARKNDLVKAAEGNAAVFTAVVATIKRERRIFGKRILFFYYRAAGKTQKFISVFPRNESPFFLDPQEKTALALVTRDGTVSILMDDALARVDLTEAERNRLCDILPGQSASPAT